jgi:sigma-B regulation protein RsbU (phosphoserine phosphatase)
MNSLHGVEFGWQYAIDSPMDTVAMRETHRVTSSETGRVLIADDQMHVLDALQMLLSGCGLATEAVTRPAGVLRAVGTGLFDAVLMDLNFTRATVEGEEGLELVSQIRSMDHLLPVVVMTAWSSVDLAVEAMRRGASDFIQKPWENQDLLQKLQNQLSWARARRRAQRQRDEELREASEIQASLLPKKLPEVAGYQLAAMTQPLRFVGGDYYNVVRISERQAALCIADVAGKGLPAALLMSSLQAALKPLIAERLAPRELCQRLNRILCDLTPVGKFISFFYAVLDSVDNRLTYCNAGHNPPLLIRVDGTSTELKAAGAVLGQFPLWLYEQSELRMRSGDRLLLFTDGLVEACNGNEESFGEQNLIRIARDNPGSSAVDLMGLLIRAAWQHSGEHFQDDASLIVLKATKKGAILDLDGGAQ